MKPTHLLSIACTLLMLALPLSASLCPDTPLLSEDSATIPGNAEPVMPEWDAILRPVGAAAPEPAASPNSAPEPLLTHDEAEFIKTVVEGPPCKYQRHPWVWSNPQAGDVILDPVGRNPYSLTPIPYPGGEEPIFSLHDEFIRLQVSAPEDRRFSTHPLGISLEVEMPDGWVAIPRREGLGFCGNADGRQGSFVTLLYLSFYDSLEPGTYRVCMLMIDAESYTEESQDYIRLFTDPFELIDAPGRAAPIYGIREIAMEDVTITVGESRSFEPEEFKVYGEPKIEITDPYFLVKTDS